MSCSRLRSQCNVFPALHQISLPGNIFGVLILDMGEGRGENFVLKLKSDVHSTRITFDLNLFVPLTRSRRDSFTRKGWARYGPFFQSCRPPSSEGIGLCFCKHGVQARGCPDEGQLGESDRPKFVSQHCS